MYNKIKIIAMLVFEKIGKLKHHQMESIIKSLPVIRNVYFCRGRCNKMLINYLSISWDVPLLINKLRTIEDIFK